MHSPGLLAPLSYQLEQVMGERKAIYNTDIFTVVNSKLEVSLPPFLPSKECSSVLFLGAFFNFIF